MAEELIRMHKLSKQYGGKQVVRAADVTVGQGRVVGLVGKNGAGKTTLLRMLTGLAFPTSGEMLLFGEHSKRGLSSARKRIGSMIETPDFYPNLTAAQNLEYYRILRGIPEKHCVQAALETAGIADTGEKTFRNFSLGMKQKLGLALAILGNPDLLLLDEPINGMDPMAIAEFRRLIVRLNQERRMTVLISSHILAELSQIASDYIFIDRGEIVEQISDREILAKCRKHLAVRVDDASRAAAILERAFDCRDFEVLSPNFLRIYAFTDAPEVLTQAFVNAGVKVSRLGAEGGNIEEYFVNLVGGGAKHV